MEKVLVVVFFGLSCYLGYVALSERNQRISAETKVRELSSELRFYEGLQKSLDSGDVELVNVIRHRDR